LDQFPGVRHRGFLRETLSERTAPGLTRVASDLPAPRATGGPVQARGPSRKQGDFGLTRSSWRKPGTNYIPQTSKTEIAIPLPVRDVKVSAAARDRGFTDAESPGGSGSRKLVRPSGCGSSEGWARLVRSYSKDADAEDLSDPSRPSSFTALGQLGAETGVQESASRHFRIDRVERPMQTDRSPPLAAFRKQPDRSL
jgi:hypothetical protein